jgi:hypothetical protein
VVTSSSVPIPAGEHVPTADQRVVTYSVPWSHYEAHLALRGDAPVPRMAYLEGALELMSPSKEHERAKSYIGRLVEAYALERGIDMSPYGAWTLKRASSRTSATSSAATRAKRFRTSPSKSSGRQGASTSSRSTVDLESVRSGSGKMGSSRFMFSARSATSSSREARSYPISI